MATWKKLTTSGDIVNADLSGSAGIVTANIAADAITSALIADDAVDTEHIADDAIVAAAIDDGAIVAAALGADCVTAAKIGDNVLNSEHYAAASIDNEHLADNAVGIAELAGIARGKIIYGDASGDPALLAAGSANKVLTSDGSDISWQTPATGDIEGVTAGVGLSGGGTSGTVSLAIDLNEFTTESAALAQGDFVPYVDISASVSGEMRKVVFSKFEDTIFGNVSGDATIAAGGALTIAATSVEGSMLNTNAISGQTEMTGDVVDADELMVSDGGTLKRADFSVVRDAVFTDVSGDATVAAGGAITIAANAIQTGMVHDDVATELAGGGLSASSGVLAVGAGTGVTIGGTTVGIGQAIGTGDSPTFTNLTLSGDLVVNGNTITTDTETIEIGSNTMILNSDLTGGTAVDAGFIVERASAGDNALLWYNESKNRWLIGTNNEADLTTSITMQGIIVTLQTSSDAPDSDDNGSGVGSLWVETDTQFAYVRTA